MRVVAEVQQWDTAVATGVDIIEAKEYAVGGIWYSFPSLAYKKKHPVLVNDF